MHWFLTVCRSVCCRPLRMCWFLRDITTLSLFSTTKYSCRSWKPISCSMHLTGWDTSSWDQQFYLKTFLNVHTVTSHCCCPYFCSRLPSLQFHKYPAAPTSSPILLYVCRAATMCMSLLWKAHACHQVSWLLVPGKFFVFMADWCSGKKTSLNDFKVILRKICVQRICLFFPPVTECWYRLVNLLGYDPLLFILFN